MSVVSMILKVYGTLSVIGGSISSSFDVNKYILNEEGIVRFLNGN